MAGGITYFYRCTKCHKEKSYCAFHTDRRNANGRTGQCKTCRNSSTSLWAAANRDRKNETDRNYKNRFPIRERARQKVKEAVRKGYLVLPRFCSLCGKKRTRRTLLQAHHPSYRSPYFIEWLCIPCHAKRHKK